MIQVSKKLLQQVLDALEQLGDEDDENIDQWTFASCGGDAAIRVLKAAIAQPVAPSVSDPLTDADITSIAYDCNALPEVVTDATLAVFARAIEARTKTAK